LYWTEHIPPSAPVRAGHRLAFAVVIVGVGLLILLAKL
jgi:hypothetical protein